MDGVDKVLYFRVMKKFLVFGMVREDVGVYKFFDCFFERMENFVKMWKFEIGKVVEFW